MMQVLQIAIPATKSIYEDYRCLFKISGLCFAELGACSPSSGSIYSYCYATLGEFMAFCMGWNLLTEYIIGKYVSWLLGCI